MGSDVTIERKGKVSIIKMNVPDKLNSLEPGLRDDFKKALLKFKEDAESPVAILTGAGRAFSAGGDLAEISNGMDAVTGVTHMHGCNEIITLITNIPKPIIAAVNGVCVGAGFSIAMACDMIFASSKAVFAQVFTKVGLAPDMGSLYFLPRAVGMHKAKELILTARMVKADEALQLGIVNEVVEPGELEAKVLAFAETIANGPGVAFSLSKIILARSLESSLQDILQLEAIAQPICMQSYDHKEGVKSFYEKRKPEFKGK